MKKLSKKQREALDFEISFCEELIKEKPDFADALIILGEAYTRRGLYDKGLGVDKRLLRLRPGDPIVTYNMACSYSLTGDIDSAIKALKEAVGKGYADFEHMKRDPDLERTRRDARFAKLAEGLNKKKGGDENGIWLIQEAEGKEGQEGREGKEEKDGSKEKRPQKEKAAEEEGR